MLEPFDYFPASTKSAATDPPRTYTALGKRYEFNQLGFRGSEYDAKAKFRVFAFGCSHTQGIGLNWEETWPVVLGEQLSRQTSIPNDDFCIMNFGQPGVSNDFITRMALRQCELVRPDLAIVQLTFMSRAETFQDGRLARVAPWMEQSGMRRAWYVLKNHRDSLISSWRYLAQASSLMRSRSTADDILRTLQNILLLQSFFKAKRIPAAISWVQHHILSKDNTKAHPTISPLLSCLSQDTFCRFGLLDNDIKIDQAVDGEHAGPCSHERFAIRLAESVADSQ